MSSSHARHAQVADARDASPPDAAIQPRELYLFLADVSGYTKFLTLNEEVLAHSHTVVTQLLEFILHHLEPPFEVSKIEGDAVFFYLPVPEDAAGQADLETRIARALRSMLEGFPDKVRDLERSRYCACQACRGISKMRLKIIGHRGQAILHRVGRFEELMGVDVILVHRLLKNHVPAKQYILLTEAASAARPEGYTVTQSAEHCEGVGNVPVHVCLPPSTVAGQPKSEPTPSRSRAAMQGTRWTVSIMWAEIASRLGLQRRWDHAARAPVGAAPPIEKLTALMMLLVLPLTLPLTLFQNTLRLLSQPPPSGGALPANNEEKDR